MSEDNFRRQYEDSVAARGAEVAKGLAASVLAICVPDRVGRPRRAGSCILMRIDGRSFVATAAHVMREAPDHRIYVGPVGGQLVTVPTPIRFPTIPGNGQDTDPYDLGLIPLPDSRVGKFAGLTFFGLDSIDENDNPELAQMWEYFVYGYPAARSHVTISHKPKVVDQTSFQLTTSATPLNQYPALGFDSQTHLVLDCDHEQIFVGGKRYNPPRLLGVSGGGVFRLRPHAPAKLVGILTDHLKTRRVIAATRVWCVVAFARQIIREKGPSIFESGRLQR